MARSMLWFFDMTTSSTPSAAAKHDRSVNVILGPPGLFIGLTLAALVAGILIVRSTSAGTVQSPAPAATAPR
jgi:hypothetical protein